MFARMLAVTIGCLMHFSLCTGGAFAVLSAGITAYATNAPEYVSTRMSYGSVGYLSCVTSKRQSQNMTSAEAQHCSDTTACLTREFARKRDLQIVSFASTPALLPPSGFLVLVEPEETASDVSRPPIIVASVHPGLRTIVKTE